MFTYQLNFCKEFLIHRKIFQIFQMRMSHAASQKRSTKGPLFREDDCTLPVFIYLLAYGRRISCNTVVVGLVSGLKDDVECPGQAGDTGYVLLRRGVALHLRQDTILLQQPYINRETKSNNLIKYH